MPVSSTTQSRLHAVRLLPGQDLRAEIERLTFHRETDPRTTFEELLIQSSR